MEYKTTLKATAWQNLIGRSAKKLAMRVRGVIEWYTVDVSKLATGLTSENGR